MRLPACATTLALMAGPSMAQTSNLYRYYNNPIDATEEPAACFRNADVVALEDVEVMILEGEELGKSKNVVGARPGACLL
ncbi:MULTISPECIES: hypothetical protein [Microvirga]|uniref:hypothetical protein n=1 Tax=Microvirga TaxID=186650 RepID=UPI00191C9319|nr:MULTISPECIES: hypothetical protein [Microvirga]MBM6581680.1 hypothetical protein [Microvirga arvi]